ncbi:unnamed protein product [Urochloa decumbens]|uniref:BTB domain-containing protein n=1 Tax=Urochloa decumbens TaxID=240449 RepID=A0ABC9BU38_9POAL
MMADSAFVRFKVNYDQAKRLAVGKAVRSDSISVGGRMWRVSCYPRGYSRKVEGWLSLYLDLMDRASSVVKAIFEAFLVDGEGQPSTDVAQWRSDVRRFEGDGSISKRHGRSRFVTHHYLEKYFVAEGHITFVCGILIVDAHPSPMSPVPPPDIGTHLAMLLESSDGWDVAFCVQGETFRAHRAILAARSPVFREELEHLGSKAQATVVVSSPPIALHEIAPATFGTLLRFIYTDALPGDDDLGGAPSVTLQCLLAAADRYALYRLKLFCAHRLWNYVTVDTAADTLACALMYECPKLKNKCIDFFAAEENFKKAVVTEGFMHLGQKFPSIITELREKVGA